MKIAGRGMDGCWASCHPAAMSPSACHLSLLVTVIFQSIVKDKAATSAANGLIEAGGAVFGGDVLCCSA